MAQIVNIAYTPAAIERKPADRFARVPLESAVLVASQGIDGDQKATRGKRQLNVMFAEQASQLRNEGFRTSPGELGEQIVIAGLPLEEITSGTRLRLGDAAVIELGELRTGCSRFEHIQRRPPSAVVGRLGYMARVITGGKIAVGSPASIEAVNEPGAARAG